MLAGIYWKHQIVPWEFKKNPAKQAVVWLNKAQLEYWKPKK